MKGFCRGSGFCLCLKGNVAPFLFLSIHDSCTSQAVREPCTDRPTVWGPRRKIAWERSAEGEWRVEETETTAKKATAALLFMSSFYNLPPP